MKRGVIAAETRQQQHQPAAPARQRTLDAFFGGSATGRAQHGVEPLERGADGSAYTICPSCGQRIALAYVKVHIDAECLRSPKSSRRSCQQDAPEDHSGALGHEGDDEDEAFLAACEAACIEVEASNTGTVVGTNTTDATQASMTDIEDLKGRQSSPLERWRRRGLFVTDLTAQAWCEAQLEANLSGDVPSVETEAMRAGTAIHDAKEAELHVRIPIDTASREDAVAVRLMNMLLMLHELRQRGITRELPLFGFVRSDDVLSWQSTQPGSRLAAGSTAQARGLPEHVMLWGIADEIRLENPQKAVWALEQQRSPRSGAIDLTESEAADRYVLRELKTRRQNSLPSDAQARGTALQLCLYKQLWDGLRAPDAATRFPSRHFWEIQRVDPKAPFSPKFAAELCSSLEPLGIGATTLSELLAHTFTLFATFPIIQAEMSVRYVLQPQTDAQRADFSRVTATSARASGEVVIGTEVVLYDREWLDACVNYAVGFWLGIRESSGASWEERFKCAYCQHSDICAVKPRSPQHGQQKHTEQVFLDQDPKRCPDDEFDDMDDLFASLPDEMLR